MTVALPGPRPAGSAGLVEDYRGLPRTGPDEMLLPDGVVRPSWSTITGLLDDLGPAGLRERRDAAVGLLEGDGVTYHPAAGDARSRWSLDPLPVLLDDTEWAALECALAQRARILDLLLTDLYSRRDTLKRRLLPASLILSHSGFIRACDRILVNGPQQLFLSAADLARGADGQWTVLHDRTQSPSGAGFAMENRRVVSRLLPGTYRDTRIQRLGPFFQAMRTGLRQMAPLTAEDPRGVLLTSGPLSETAFDQAFLSSLLGYPLAEGSDLSVRDGRLWLRGIDGPEQVDIVFRRVDSLFADPLELRPDSHLGVPGLLEASRLGSVSVVNGLGSGILENPGILPFLPAIAEALLGESLQLPSAQTWWCGESTALQHVLTHLHELVIKPTDRGTGIQSRFGWELSEAERSELKARIAAEPHLWVGQEPLASSTVPTVSREARAEPLEPRSMLLRTFAVASSGGYYVLPGGLVRVAPRPDTLFITNQAGATAKDAWVLTAREWSEPAVATPAAGDVEQRTTAVSPRVAEDLFWLGRYAERAEATTRLLRTVRDRAGDFTRSAEAAGAAVLAVLLDALTEVTGTWPGAAVSEDESASAAAHRELLALIVDGERAGTLAFAVRRLTDIAHAVRDQLSPDTWLVLGSLDRELRELADAGASADAQAGPTLGGVLEGLLALSGIAADSMVRDLGWQFLQSGRRIERAQQVTALLRATVVNARRPDVDGLVLESVLTAGESLITHRRRYAPRAGIVTVLELLLTDKDNPRSVTHQLDRLGEHLVRLPGGARADDLRDMLVRTRNAVNQVRVESLASTGADGARTELVALLGDLDQRLRRLARGIELAYFEALLPPRPLDPAQTIGTL